MDFVQRKEYVLQNSTGSQTVKATSQREAPEASLTVYSLCAMDRYEDWKHPSISMDMVRWIIQFRMFNLLLQFTKINFYKFFVTFFGIYSHYIWMSIISIIVEGIIDGNMNSMLICIEMNGYEH